MATEEEEDDAFASGLGVVFSIMRGNRHEHCTLDFIENSHYIIGQST